MGYTGDIRFEWDEAKSDACFADRGFDFEYAASAFADPGSLQRQDMRFQYAEDRFQLLGRIEGRLYVVIYTVRDGVIRIISARKANRREVARYERRSKDD